MQHFKGDLSLSGSVVTIGNFDGVHLGHQALVRELIKQAKIFRVPSVLMTFNPHPVQVLFPDKKFWRLQTFSDQKLRLEKLGLDILWEVTFDSALAQLSAEEFFEKYIELTLNLKSLIVGHDFALGKNRGGNKDFFTQRSQQKSWHLVQVPPLIIDNEVVSSSRIREALSKGEVVKAKALLGRNYDLSGSVIKGEQRGRQIGVPTANVTVGIEIPICNGVYVTQTKIGDKIVPSITNYGLRPTVNKSSSDKLMETHLFDFNQDLYGQSISVEFLNFLRPEKRFDSFEQLKNQIQLDLAKAREFFGERCKNS